MRAAADASDEARWARVSRAQAEDAVEQPSGPLSGGAPSFLHGVQQAAMGGDGGMSMEEAVRRRQHYVQRGSGASETNAFRR